MVEGGVIADVGPAAQLRARYPGVEVRDYPGCALLPGLVNVHTHLDYSAFGGFAPSRGFIRWILRLTRARRRLSVNDLAASALWGAYECLRHGVTSIADTSFGGGTVARAARAAGLRARVYLEVFGLNDDRLAGTMERLEAALQEAGREATQEAGSEGVAESGGERHRSAPPPLVEWGISPHAPYTVSQALYGEVARLARRDGLRMATHVAESKTEVKLLSRGSGALALLYKLAGLLTGSRWRLPGVRPLQYVAASGALGPDMLVVHAVQMDDCDIATLARSGAAVAHCPRSNRRLRCGVAPVAEMIASGITVGLGTDSLASNDSLDMLAEMRLAFEVSRGRAPRQGVPAPSLLPSTVLQMATLDGARALGWQEMVGSLQVGKRADLAAVRLPAGVPHAASTDTLAQAVMEGEVQMTMVEGRVVYEGADMPLAALQGLSAVRAKLGLRG